MAEQSFTITLANNRTEKAGIEYLMANATGYFYVDNATRKRILELLGMPVKYVRAFDGGNNSNPTCSVSDKSLIQIGH